VSSPADRRAEFGVALVAPLALGSLLNPINSSMIATALEPIGRAFAARASETVWLVAALYVTSAVAQPTMGKLADRWGARRVFLLGLVVVLIGGVAGAVAPSLDALIGVRVVLGIGTSAAYPSAMRVLRTHARRVGRDTPRAVLAVLSLAALSTMAIGPTLGGILTGAAGWRAIFLVNVPLAAIGIALCLLFVAPDDHHPAEAPGARLDVVGIALFAGAVVAGMLFAMGIAAGPRWWLVPVFAGCVLALVAHSLRRAVARPFIDLRMLARNRALSATYLRFGLTCVLAYAILYGFAQWLEGALGYTPTEAGLATLPLSITSMATSLLSSRMHTLRAPLALTAVALLAGCLGLLVLDDGASHLAIAGVGVLFGLAQGMSSVANQAAVYDQAPADEIGSAAGLQRTAGYLGAVVASSLLGWFYGGRASTPGLHALAVAMLALGAVLLAITLLDPALRTEKPQPTL